MNCYCLTLTVEKKRANKKINVNGTSKMEIIFVAENVF